jgi:flagellin
MSLRVNTNVAALNAHRHVQNVNAKSMKNLEKLSSGMRINSAADGPASLVVSEVMRAQISGLNQAVENSENGVSMVQTAEGALSEVNRLLTDMRQLAVHASNVGVNDERMLEADQAEFANSLKSINRIATNTQFGNKQLLDGSRGANGVANGPGLQFVGAAASTKSSPRQGYNVAIEQAATRSTIKGSVALTQALVDAGETLTVTENGKTIQFTTKEGDTVESTINELKRQIRAANLQVDVVDTQDGTIQIRHQDYGSKYSLSVASSTAGVLSTAANVMEKAQAGLDVKGFIAGEEAVGDGQTLTGRDGNQLTEGLSVRYTSDTANPNAGTVTVLQNSLIFQTGSNYGQTVSVSLRDMKASALGSGVTNESGFRSLEDVDLRGFQGAQDAINVIDKAIDQTAQTRADLGALQKNTLETNISTLRIAVENMTASESVIRDADMAKEMAEFTRNQILTQSSMSMLAQANQQARNVLSILGS